MDVLTVIFCRAEEEGIFEPLHRWGVKHRNSIYADDVAMFVGPFFSKWGSLSLCIEKMHTAFFILFI
jgi:hypothetical protein